MFSDDAYNKNINNDAGEGGAGTLMANWAEERVLREATGEGRTVPQRHIPRSGLLEDFTKVPLVAKKGDDTFNRVYGPKVECEAQAASKTIGVPDRHAGKIVHVGPQAEMLKTGRFQAAEEQVLAEEAEYAKEAQLRRFDTTTGSTHCKPNELLAERAAHGRKSFRDEIIRGPAPDRTLAMHTEALDVHSHTHYSNAETITHPRMCLSDPAMRSDLQASACGGVNAFGKHGEFTKSVAECTLGLAKDEELSKMYDGLKDTNALRQIGGHQPRGPFAAVPSLASLKSAVHNRMRHAWGDYGYVVLRQRLFDVGDPEGFVPKGVVAAILREELGLTADEASDEMLDVWLGQLVTMKASELKIAALLASLRPALPQKDKRRVLEAWRAMAAGGAEARLGTWLDSLADASLRAMVVGAFGAQDEAAVANTAVSEQMFLELLSDLAPFVDLAGLLG